MIKPAAETKQPRKYLTRMMVCPQSTKDYDSQLIHGLANCAVYSDGTYYCFGCGARGKV